MLKQNKTLIRNILLLIDGSVLLLSFLLSYKIRLLPLFEHAKPIHPMTQYIWLAIAAVPIWWLQLFFQDLYRSQRVLSYGTLIWRLTKITFTSAIILGTLIFIFQAKTYSRSLFGVFILTSFLCLNIERCFIKLVAHAVRRRGYNYRNILIIGVNERTKHLIQRIISHPEWSLKIIGTLSTNASEDPLKKLPIEVPLLGTLDDLDTIVQQYIIDEIIFSLEKSDLLGIEEILLRCEELGIRTHLVADFFNLIIAKTELSYMEEIPLLTFSTTPFQDLHLIAKRSVDLFTSLIVLITLSPLYFAIAILIKLDSKGPVLFKQIRVGLNGHKFKLLKFRSMVKDAESQLETIQDLNEMSGPVFKSSHDPRITKFGHFLRKFSLDELPQMINVLKNDMSLVGPRPPLAEEVEKYERWQRRRLSMKPGITCLWQISGRSNIDFDEWMKLDLQYIDHWSLGLDFKILFKTIPAVLSARGAK